MAYDEFLLKRTTESTSVDGSVLYNVPDDDYGDYVRYGLFFVDHHGSLRFEGTGQIIATNREQLDMIIAHLNEIRDMTQPRDREPSRATALEFMPDQRDFT